MLLLKDGTVVTGDGYTLLEKASVVVEGTKIADVLERRDEAAERYAERVIDCAGKCILPGMINHHVHGVVFGPVFASGAAPYPRSRVLELLDRNLLQGQTTVLNVDGFATMEEVRETQRAHPVRIKTATTHFPAALEAADRCDGSGLGPAHREMTVEKMLELGAVAIGEVGGGHTLGGGGQDYIYIPRAVKEKTGRDIDSFQARALKLAVLGHYIDPAACDLVQVAGVLREIGLEGALTPEEAKRLVVDTVMPSVQVTLDGYRDAARLALKLDVPVIMHNAPTSMKVVHEVARLGVKRLIAAHSNYLFTREEAVENTRKLREYPGVIIDAAVHDPFGAKRLVSGPENLFAFFQHDLADIISTDFAAGEFDSMLQAIEEGVARGLISLPKAVALGTKRVADSIPGLAPGLGLLARGYEADILVTEYPRVSRVDTVLIAGRVVAEGGRRVA